MFEPMQIITFQCTEGNTCTPQAPQYAGTQGDNGKTRVDFVLPADALGDANVYRAEMVTGGGALITSGLLTPAGGIVSLPLTHLFTEAGGRCTVRLIVTQIDENGDEVGEYCAMVGHVYFSNSPTDTLPAIKHGISEMLLNIARDSELTEQAAIRAAADAESAHSDALNAAEAGEIAENAAESARLSAMEADTVVERFSNRYAPAAAVTATGNPAVLKGCADAYLMGLSITGNNTQAETPDVSRYVPIDTAFAEDGWLTVSSETATVSLDISDLCLEKWDTLFLDKTDHLWKVLRNTETVVYGSSNAVYETTDTATDVIRYSLAPAVFTTVRRMEDGVCTHLPILRENVQEAGVLIGFGSGAYINVRLPKADFPDTAAVKQWLAEQEAAGTPFTVKFRSDNSHVETLAEAWQTQLNALATVCGDNTVTVSGSVLPSAVSVTAVADTQALIPTHSSGMPVSGEKHILQPQELCTAHSPTGNFALYQADGTLLISSLTWLHAHTTDAGNGSYRAIIQYQRVGGALTHALYTLTEGTYIKSSGTDVCFASIC